MRGLLVRVGVDQKFGEWNGPVDLETREFVYVPIPDQDLRPGMETPYASVVPALSRFPSAPLPERLRGRMMHLDPDFEHLTYGDNGRERGAGAARLTSGDFIAFYASLRPVQHSRWLLYALIGFFRVREVVWARTVSTSSWAENAHTRRVEHTESDVIVRAERGASGRLRRCIPIGEWRNRSYRVRNDLLDAWGGISCKDGFIQRSIVPPSFSDPERFIGWFDQQRPELLAANNP